MLSVYFGEFTNCLGRAPIHVQAFTFLVAFTFFVDLVTTARQLARQRHVPDAHCLLGLDAPLL